MSVACASTSLESPPAARLANRISKQSSRSCFATSDIRASKPRLETPPSPPLAVNELEHAPNERDPAPLGTRPRSSPERRMAFQRWVARGRCVRCTTRFGLEFGCRWRRSGRWRSVASQGVQAFDLGQLQSPWSSLGRKGVRSGPASTATSGFARPSIECETSEARAREALSAWRASRRRQAMERLGLRPALVVAGEGVAVRLAIDEDLTNQSEW
jgi:hypothetical protein